MIENFKEFIVLHPHYGYLIAAAGCTLYLIGAILDWDWVVEPGGGYFNIAYWIRIFGRKTIRICIGVFTSIGIICCIALFLYYNYIT
ncbi:immunity 17 family protein [Aquimarina addita]|uniref:immunity 17 family protein n=1 Tax=Aquimarina addita TaxID=870485 RepID=UPI0031E67754